MVEKINRLQTEAKINVRAWKDPEFKEQLRVNPHEALKEMGMTRVPNGLDIQLAEEEKNQWVIRLYNRPLNFKELSDDELEKVAMGEPQEAKCCPKKPS